MWTSDLVLGSFWASLRVPLGGGLGGREKKRNIDLHASAQWNWAGEFVCLPCVFAYTKRVCRKSGMVYTICLCVFIDINLFLRRVWCLSASDVSLVLGGSDGQCQVCKPFMGAGDAEGRKSSTSASVNTRHQARVKHQAGTPGKLDAWLPQSFLGGLL